MNSYVRKPSCLHFVFLVCLFLGPGFTTQIHSQACGYSYSKFWVTDTNGSSVEGVKFRFQENGTGRIATHSNEANAWVSSGNMWSHTEGMCGGHRGVMVTVEADGFEPVTHQIDLLLNRPERPQLFRVKLGRKGSKEVGAFRFLSKLVGTVFDPAGAVITNAIVRTTVDGQPLEIRTNEDGEFVLLLPYNHYDSIPAGSDSIARYSLTFVAAGFKNLVYKDLNFAPAYNGAMRLDVSMEVGGCHDCHWIESGLEPIIPSERIAPSDSISPRKPEPTEKNRSKKPIKRTKNK